MNLHDLDAWRPNLMDRLYQRYGWLLRPVWPYTPVMVLSSYWSGGRGTFWRVTVDTDYSERLDDMRYEV